MALSPALYMREGDPYVNWKVLNSGSYFLSGQMGGAFESTALLPTLGRTSDAEVDQLLEREDRITNLVYMGMGEPVHNLENLLTALDICMDDHALNLSHRRITVSTVGLLPKMVELARRSPVNLAISLNASTEEHRRSIMPITRKYSMASLLDACREMDLPTGKRIAFEYVLFEGENDSLEDAERVLELLKGGGMTAGEIADRFPVSKPTMSGHFAKLKEAGLIDGVRFGLQFGSIRFNALIAFTDIGALTARPGWEGQDRDLGGQDDTITWSLRLTSAPRTAEERAKRRVLLNERRRVAIDWGIFASFTEQVLTARNQPAANLSGSCTPYAQTANGTLSLPWNCWQLTPRDLFIARPSVWTRFEWRPDFRSTLKLELEFSAFIGDATTLQGDPDLGDTSKDFLGFAGALEFSFSRNRWRVGLDAGFATGDDGRYLGYLDGQNIVDPDDANYLANDNVRLNSQVTSFWFHRDYRLDLILFRQVLGGVTNAIYVKPYASFHLLKNSNIALSARLDILYAAAARPSGTPGKGHHYGVEFDASLRLELAKGLGIDLTAGVLVPMDALRDPDTLATPNPAYAIRGLFTWRY